MRQIRKRLTYANVMSSMAVFLVLGGGAAVAAKQVLEKSSVGTKQLKSNAVTTAKIKKNAVSAAKIKANAITGAKIKNGAVTGSKVADGSITGTDIEAASTPFGRVVAKMRGTSSLGVNNAPQVYPLSPSTYTQGSEENNSFVGAVDVSFPSSCEQPRSAVAFLLVDNPNPTSLSSEAEISSLGEVADSSGGTVNKRIQISPFFVKGVQFEPGVTTTHSVSLVVEGECKTGGGITAGFGGVDVLGIK